MHISVNYLLLRKALKKMCKLKMEKLIIVNIQCAKRANVLVQHLSFLHHANTSALYVHFRQSVASPWIWFQHKQSVSHEDRCRYYWLKCGTVSIVRMMAMTNETSFVMRVTALSLGESPLTSASTSDGIIRVLGSTKSKTDIPSDRP